jgi:hypothetical protein
LGESVADQGQLPIQGIQILLDELTINGSGNREAQGQQHQGGGQGEQQRKPDSQRSAQ